MNRSGIEFIWECWNDAPMTTCVFGSGYRDIKNHVWLQEMNFGKLIKKKIQVGARCYGVIGHVKF